MFTNAGAIRMLIENDSTASSREKKRLIGILEGKPNRVEAAFENRLAVKIGEAAEMLGMGRQAVRKAVRNGKLIGLSAGRSRRISGISIESIKEFLEGGR